MAQNSCNLHGLTIGTTAPTASLTFHELGATTARASLVCCCDWDRRPWPVLWLPRLCCSLSARGSRDAWLHRRRWAQMTPDLSLAEEAVMIVICTAGAATVGLAVTDLV